MQGTQSPAPDGAAGPGGAQLAAAITGGAGGAPRAARSPLCPLPPGPRPSPGQLLTSRRRLSPHTKGAGREQGAAGTAGLAAGPRTAQGAAHPPVSPTTPPPPPRLPAQGFAFLLNSRPPTPPPPPKSPARPATGTPGMRSPAGLRPAPRRVHTGPGSAAPAAPRSEPRPQRCQPGRTVFIYFFNNIFFCNLFFWSSAAPWLAGRGACISSGAQSRAGRVRAPALRPLHPSRCRNKSQRPAAPGSESGAGGSFPPPSRAAQGGGGERGEPGQKFTAVPAGPGGARWGRGRGFGWGMPAWLRRLAAPPRDRGGGRRRCESREPLPCPLLHNTARFPTQTRPPTPPPLHPEAPFLPFGGVKNK